LFANLSTFVPPSQVLPHPVLLSQPRRLLLV
jgi:hypothetical protein